MTVIGFDLKKKTSGKTMGHSNNQFMVTIATTGFVLRGTSCKEEGLKTNYIADFSKCTSNCAAHSVQVLTLLEKKNISHF